MAKFNELGKRLVKGLVTVLIFVVVFVLVVLVASAIVQVGWPHRREIFFAITTFAASALVWAGDHWFQILVLVFMARVWVGLSVANGFIERMYVALVKDQLAQVLRWPKSTSQPT